MPSRRSVLQLTGLGAAAVTVSAAKAISAPPTAVSAVGGHNHHGASTPTTRPASAGTRPPIDKFSRPLALLPTAEPVRQNPVWDVYESVIEPVRTEIFPGHPTTVYGYFGSWIPPVIRAKKGRRTAVVQRNRTRVPVSVHLHGGRTAAEHDGQMSTPIAPGESFTYRYDNDQSAAALWLHDHTHMTDAENVYHGMASPYIIESEEESELGLPSGGHEIPLLLRDGDFGSKGQFVYTMDDTANRSTVLVNGRPWPYLKVAARKYRFRVINGSNMRFFVLGLSSQTTFTQIGGDCGLLEAPLEAPVVALSPGERADVVIDFAAFKPGTTVDLINYVGPGNMDDVGQVMRFTVGEPETDKSVVPDQLTSLPAIPKADRTRKFSLVSSEPGETPMTGTINGRTFDMDRIDFTVPFGSTEEWQIVNDNKTVPHNFHAHLAHMRVLTRGGKPVRPEEAGVKDTVAIYPGETVTARLTFDKHRGIYPVHCHMLDHGAMGMMAQLRVR